MEQLCRLPRRFGRKHVDVTRTRLQDGRAVDSGTLASRSEPPSSDDDAVLSDSDLESNSDDGGCLSEAEGCSSTRKQSRWSKLDEQRLLAYKENKSWGVDLWQVPW